MGKALEKEKTIGIAIFVKTPGISSVKTRLAQSIGVKTAENIYLSSIKAIKSILGILPDRYCTYWAIAEEEAMDHPLWKNDQKIFQSKHTLGERLDHVYTYLMNKHEKVMMIGADCPHLKKEEFLGCETLLAKKPYVLGFASDGGFWIFSGREKVSKEIWTSVPYSSPQTGHLLEKFLGGKHWVERFSEKSDIDHKEDLFSVLEELKIMNKTDEQSKLQDQIQSIF